MNNDIKHLDNGDFEVVYKTDPHADIFEMKKHPALLTGYLKGLASRIGGADEPILMAASDYIREQEDCSCSDEAEETCINHMCPRRGE